MAMMSPSLTGMDRPAASTRPGRGPPSSTAGRRAESAASVSAIEGTRSSPERKSRGRPRTTLSRATVTLASPSAAAAARMAGAGRTKTSKR